MADKLPQFGSDRIKVARIPSKGRALIAAKSIKKGDLSFENKFLRIAVLILFDFTPSTFTLWIILFSSTQLNLNFKQ